MVKAKILYTDKKYSKPHVKNYIVYPIYKNHNEKNKKWEADNKKYANMIHVDMPKSISEQKKNKKTALSVVENNYIWSTCLTDMRQKMISKCDYRIAAGGKFTNYKGIMPGVLEEILIAINMKKPLYLLGGFGGVVSDVCEIIKSSNSATKLTEKWQRKNNPNYSLFLDYLNKNNKDMLPNYNNLTTILTLKNLNNGLDKNDNFKLFSTPFVDEAIYLVMKGLKQLKDNEKNK